MIRTRVFVVVVVAALLAIAVGKRLVVLQTERADSQVSIAFAYDPDENGPVAASSRAAYTEVSLEEGIPSTWISTDDLFLSGAAMLRRHYRAIVFPDGLDERLSAELEGRIASYVRMGGTVAVVYDAGSRDKHGAFLDDSAFSTLIGVDYGGYTLTHPARAPPPGTVTFASAAAARSWGFPPGKLDGDRLVGYKYGALFYPMGRADAAPRDDITTFAHFGDSTVLSTRRVGGGHAIWVDLPLGYLKAHGDALPLHTILRTIARRFARVPYLVPVPRGIGTIIIDWHVDSSIEYRGIPNALHYR
ncbi:MAG: hypothetical protein ACREM6_07395, partial [Vulcanimicrobiaceae bacterium]